MEEAGAAVVEAGAVEEVGESVGRLIAYERAVLPSQFREWVELFLADPNGAHGLHVPVCPALPNALRYGRIVVGSVHSRDVSISALCADLGLAVQASREYLNGDGGTQSAVVWIFDGLPPYALRSCLEPAFHAARDVAVSLGIMSGCFHPYRIRRSRVAPSVQTMTSPVPAVAFRSLRPFDAPSFDGDDEGRTRFEEWVSVCGTSQLIQMLESRALLELAALISGERSRYPGLPNCGSARSESDRNLPG